MKTEEVIEIKPLEEGDTLIENYKVITHMRRGKDCDLYHLWSEERMCSVIGKTVQPNAAAKEKAAARLTREEIDYETVSPELTQRIRTASGRCACSYPGDTDGNYLASGAPDV